MIRRAAALTLCLALLAGAAPPARAAGKGGQATNFTLRDLQGRFLRLSDYADKVVLMSFWATWCKPCIKELTHLAKLYEKLKGRGFVVLAISIDGPETQSKVNTFVKRYRFPFPVAIDAEKRVVKLYNPKNAAPFSVFLKRGRVIKTREGFEVSDLPAIEKEILDLLK